jgi:hypothetical protein
MGDGNAPTSLSYTQPFNPTTDNMMTNQQVMFDVNSGYQLPPYSFQNGLNMTQMYSNYYPRTEIPSDAHHLNTSINNLERNETSTLCWKDILNPNFTMETLLENINQVVSLPKMVFVNEYKQKLCGNSKYNKQKFETLRNELFKLLLNKLGYSGQPIILNKEKTGMGFADDLFNICVCFVEEEIKMELLDLFANDQSKKTSC